jgi:hypothetical protein
MMVKKDYKGVFQIIFLIILKAIGYKIHFYLVTKTCIFFFIKSIIEELFNFYIHYGRKVNGNM